MIFLLLLNILTYLTFAPAEQGGVLIKQYEVKGFQNAVSISPDNLGQIYVLDNKANQVIKLNENLVEVKSIDASTGLDLFICDGKNNRIERFDRNLNYISSLVTNLTTFLPQYQFNTPISSILMNSNDMYVFDKDNNRVVIFKDGLNPVNSFGEYQNSNGRIAEGKKMVKDKNNFIFIHDVGQNAVLKFDNFGSFMKKIKIDTIYSISVYNNNLYLLTNNKVYSYNIEKNTFDDFYDLMEYKTISDFTDFVVLNEEKYLILEKNKLSYWKLVTKN